jgi:hypothetical protein
MMKARLAGLILLMGVSMAAQAHHSHTFVLDNEGQDVRAAIRHFVAKGHHDVLADIERGNVIKVAAVRDGDGDFNGCPGPIPEPGTYAMLLAGLGLMTTIARRKRMDR